MRYDPKTKQWQRAELVRAVKVLDEWGQAPWVHDTLRDILMELDAAEEIAKRHFECPHDAVKAGPGEPRCDDCGSKVPAMMFRAYMDSFPGFTPPEEVVACQHEQQEQVTDGWRCTKCGVRLSMNLIEYGSLPKGTADG